jgi:ribosome-binding protein aMBF1 (putative translation factor)
MDERRQQPDRRVEPRGGRRAYERAGDQLRIKGAVANRIAEGMRQKGLTILQTAVKAGMDYSTVREAMRGEADPRLSTLVALACVLEIPLAELVTPRAA